MSSTETTQRDPDKRVRFFDTSLRDGEQAPGIHLNQREKVEIAQQLARLGVDVIEAGFPISSQGDFEGVRAIAGEVEGPIIAGLSRANEKDIMRCYEAVKDAPRHRIHTFIATSDIHLEWKLKMTREEVLKTSIESVRLARSLVEDVEFSCEDSTRSDTSYIAEVVAAAIEEGATTINLPDTVGYTMPEEFTRFLMTVYEKCPTLADVTLSVHCHNDLGLAVANSLAGLHAGARQIEGCVNGIGERAGNASLEEVAMILRTRADDVDGLWCDLNTEEITRTSRMISRFTGYVIQPNKAVVGRNAFAHEAGIHQHGVLENPLNYEIMDPKTVGLEKSELVLGKHSGRHALQAALLELGYELDKDEMRSVFERFKDVADKKGELSALDLEALMGDEMRVGEFDGFTLTGFTMSDATGEAPTATVTVTGSDGNRVEGTGTGDGPVDALMKAIDDAIGTDGTLLEYAVNAVTSGRDALGEARVVAEIDGLTRSGLGMSTDVLEASAIAYIRAVNASRGLEESEPVGGI